MFEQTFKNIDDILHKDAGCGSELDARRPRILFLTNRNILADQRVTKT